MAARPYVLSEITYQNARETSYQLAVLPWGATEAHNLHLPYATDNIETEHIATEAARLAWERGVKSIVLPTVPFGVQTGQLDIPFCLNLNPSTQLQVLTDLVHALARQGTTKLVILNGHGGNDFKPVVRELLPRFPIFLCVVDWYTVIDPKSYFDDLGDHAGELETSIMLHAAPDLVRLKQAGRGAAKRFRIKGLREKWAWAPRRWTQVTKDTGVGDPSAASAEKGARYVTAVTAKIADFLVELAGADPADLYE